MPEPQDAARSARSEPCYFFRLSAFQDRLLKHYEENPDFIQPESRRNEIVSLDQDRGAAGRQHHAARARTWGIRVPFDPEFTIYVWFDALLTYITGIGYGDDEATFRKYWPADIHFIGKDITRFHCALWPAMLWAAGRAAAEAGVRARVRLRQERGDRRRREDQQVAGQRRRADGRHHEVQRPRRSATTSCASARSRRTASSAGSGSRRSTTPTWRTTSATCSAA